MKRTTAIITLALLLLAMISGCKTNTTTPSASPNVPVVSQSPAIPSPTTGESPAATGQVSPSPAASPAASPSA